jgi:hypothetical protein
MAGFMLMRARVLLYAMLLSPFLAVDLFFSISFFKSSEKANDFAVQIRNITNTFRGDFYDALVKGPVMLFFLFLIGVFASAIFNGNMATEIQKVASSSDGLKGMSPYTIASVYFLFKFAIFFALWKFTFDKIKEAKPFGENGKRLSGFGSS